MNDLIKMREKDVVTGIIILIVVNFILGFIVAQNLMITKMKPYSTETGIVIEVFGSKYTYK